MSLSVNVAKFQIGMSIIVMSLEPIKQKKIHSFVK